MKILKMIVTTLALLLAANVVHASTHEWISSSLQIIATPNNSTCIIKTGSTTFNLTNNGGCTYDLKVGLNGDSTWLENTAFYYKQGAGAWNMFTDHAAAQCKTQLNLNPPLQVYYTCANIALPAIGVYTFRGSINYNGCGGWTPTPNVATCGDTGDLTVFVN